MSVFFHCFCCWFWILHTIFALKSIAANYREMFLCAHMHAYIQTYICLLLVISVISVISVIFIFLFFVFVHGIWQFGGFNALMFMLHAFRVSDQFL